MAGSRLPAFGTIFSRVTGLIRGKGITELPLWYNVYKKHPPDIEPNAERPMPPQEPIPEIVYEEDFERAKESNKRWRNIVNFVENPEEVGREQTEAPNEPTQPEPKPRPTPRHRRIIKPL